MNGGQFQVSVNGVNFTTVASITDAGAGWNMLNITYNTPVRYIRYTNPATGNCQAVEFEFVGYYLAVPDVGPSSSSCRVNVSTTPAAQHPSLGLFTPAPRLATVIDYDNTGGLGVISIIPGMEDLLNPTSKTVVVPTLVASTLSQPSQPFSLLSSQTPVVTLVSPRWGTALGGTLITISGTNLPTTVASTFVGITGDPCNVTAVSTDGTWVQCVTTRRSAVRPTPTLTVGHLNADGSSGGFSVSNSTTISRHLDRWSALTTWAREELPVEGDTVVIPQGQSVLLDVSPPELFVLLVQGTLVFDRQDLTVDATYIYIPGGHVEIGTEAEPFLNKATITLHGDRYKTIELPDVGSKVLAVSNQHLWMQFGSAVPKDKIGTLDIHGRPRQRVWTKVAADAIAGSNTFVTSEDVDYEPGEKIVLSSSDDFEENEELTVVSLGADKRTITVTPALRFTHKSRIVQVAGETVDMRCEVGLISRNIVIQGDDKSDAQLFGAHTICVHGGIYRIENTELRRCGQAGIMGRYCVHWHMAFDERPSYAKSNSIHNGFQRATTVHGSHYVTVSQNFAYHIMGHTYFIEDGGEHDNIFEENLGVYTLPLSIMLKSDTEPAVFWTSSPTNIWRHNVAGGSAAHGFWLELPGNPGGPSYTPNICPVHEQLGQFFNNTAHTAQSKGLRLYPQYTPLERPCDPTSPSKPMFFYNLTSFHNGDNGIFGKLNGDLHHVNAKLVENGGDEFHLVKFQRVNYNWLANINNTLMVGSLTGVANGKYAMSLPQNEFFYVSGAKIINYGTQGAIAGCTKCDDQSDYRQGGYTVRFEGLQFTNVAVRTHWREPRKDIFWDLDGSLSGQVGGWVTPFYGFNNWPECPRAGAVYKFATICNSSVQVRRLQIDRVNPWPLDFQVLQLASTVGNGTIRFRPKEIYGWTLPVVTSHFYKSSFLALSDWESMRLRYSEPEYVQPGEWLSLSWNYTDYRYQFSTTYSDSSAVVPSLPDQTYPLTPTLSFGTGLINTVGKSFDIILATGSGVDTTRTGFPGPYSVVTKPIQCAPGNTMCSFQTSTPLKYPPVLWSMSSSWATNAVPGCGQNVTIPAGVIMQLDISPCALGAVTIFGKLQFLDNGDKVFEAKSITVFGYLEIGVQAMPFTSKAEIVINGVRTDPTVIVSNSLFLGNKVMAVFGQVSLWGKARVVPWTKLASTVLPGSNSLTVQQPVDWVAGDSIVLTTTEYDASQTESLTVASVSADGLSVTFTSPVAFRHFSGRVDDGAGNFVPLAAEVGVVNRNIVIRGRLQDATDVYGAHIFVGDVAFAGGQKQVGSFVANGVQFDGTGKQGMQYPSIWFSYTTLGTDPTTWPLNVVNGSSFFNSLNLGVMSNGARGLNISNNVFHRTYGSCVFADDATRAISVIGNLVAGNLRLPTDPFDWVRPFAGFYIATSSVAALQGNVVGGTEDTGFVLYGEACGVANPVIANNEVHGALVGGWLLSQRETCRQLVNFVAWKCGHIGVLTLDQTANVLLRNVTVADNHIGISLNFFQSGNRNRADIVNSRIFGSTAASTCSASTTCRAQTETNVFGTTCGSVFGTSYRRVGLMVPQYLNRAKTCTIDGELPVCRPITTPTRLCSLPWEKRYGLPGSSIHGEVYVSGTAFGYFQPVDCGMQSVGLALNPTQIEYTPHLFFSGVSWPATHKAARMDLGLTPKFAGQCQTACDSLNFVLATDTDGTFYPEAGSSAGGVFLSENNPALAYTSPLCRADADLSGTYCPNRRFFKAMLENRDLDRGSRLIGPVVVTKYSNLPDNRTYFSNGPFNDECAKRFFFGQYPFSLEPGFTYDVVTAGSMPSTARVQFNSKSPSDVVLLRIFYTRPYRVAVSVGSSAIAPSTTRPTLASSRGANVFDPQERFLYLVLRGSTNPDEQIYNLVTLSIIELSLTIGVSRADFFGPNLVSNLAALLGIPASRIAIVEVQDFGSRRRDLDSGDSSSNNSSTSSIEVNMEILPPVSDSEIADDNEALLQNQQAQALLTQQISTLATSGELKSSLAASGIPLEGLAITPPPSAGGASSAIYFVPVDAPTSKSSSNNDSTVLAIAAGVGGGFLLLMALAAVVVVQKRRSSMVVKPLPPLQEMVVPEFVEPQEGGAEGDLVMKESSMDAAFLQGDKLPSKRLAYFDNVHIMDGAMTVAEQQSRNSTLRSLHALPSSVTANPLFVDEGDFEEDGNGYIFARRPSLRTEEDVRTFSALVIPQGEEFQTD